MILISKWKEAWEQFKNQVIEWRMQKGRKLFEKNAQAKQDLEKGKQELRELFNKRKK